MQSSSDTEPESDHDEAVFEQTTRVQDLSQPASFTPIENIDEDIQPESILSAVRTLEQGSPLAVCSDSGFRSIISRCLSIFCSFLEGITTTIANQNIGGCAHVPWSSFLRLANPPFLSLLFEYRNALRKISQDSSYGVDYMLAKLAICTIVIAGGSFPVEHSNLSAPLKQKLQEDCVRAAAQLPDRWSSILRIFEFESASPGALRLSFRLLFLAYVMAPHIADIYEAWLDDSLSAAQVMHSMCHYIGRMTTENLTHMRERAGICELDNYAMAVSIFSVAQRACKGSDAPSLRSPTILLHSGAFLRLMVIILDSATTGNRDRLTLAQTIVLRWGDFVPWCWSVWDDDRTAHIECITDLTINWIRHLDTPFCVQNSRSSLRERVYMLVQGEGAPLGNALNRAIHSIICTIKKCQEKGSPSTYSDLGIILMKACWAHVKLMQRNAAVVNTAMEGQAPMTCRNLIDAFTLLDVLPSKSKQTIIDGLTTIQPRTFRSLVVRLFQEPSVHVASKIHLSLTDTKKRLCRLVKDHCFDSGEIKEVCLDTANCLQMLSLLLHSKHDELTLQGGLLSLVLTVYSLRDSGLLNEDSSLRGALLCASSVLERVAPRVAADLPENLVWDLMFFGDNENLIVTAHFASFILSSQREFDPLSYAEAYNHLLDALSAIIFGRFLDGEQILAILIFPSICLALEKILRTVSQSGLDYMISSPWMTSVRENLEFLIDRCDDTRSDGYLSTLYHKSAQEIKWLTQQLKQRGAPPSKPVDYNTELGDILRWRWISWHGHTDLNLILVPL